MSRLIDADALKIPSTSVDMFENCRNCRLLDEEQVREIIDNAPTIDAVSVVRCSECRWSRPGTFKGETGYRCVFYRVDKAETGYCDCGERKESE